MKIVKENSKVVDAAVDTLKNGGLVIFPTETLYGIGADSSNKKAILKLNKFKKRALGKPYSIAVSNQEMAEKFVYLNQTAKNLYKEFLPGPITVISKGKKKVAPGVESETGTLGIRIPNYPLVIKIVTKLGHPITATSANSSYKRRPYKISDILENISQRQRGLIDLIIDAGELPHNDPSTVIDTTRDDLSILRQGEIKIKNKNVVTSRSEENTQTIAKELWQKYESYLGKRPIIFALEGPMGAGKTQFTKGLAKAMEIKDEIISPTYNLMFEYKSKKRDLKLKHVDSWKFQNAKELEQLGFIKMLEENNMVISIEWADRVADVVREHRENSLVIWVIISYGKGINERLISWGTI